MFKMAEGGFAFPKLMSVSGNSFFGWRFCILALFCLEFHQLPNMYIFVLQILQHFLHCGFLYVIASMCHLDAAGRLASVVGFKMYAVELSKLGIMTPSLVYTVSSTSSPHYYILNSDQIFLNFIHHFSLENLHFVPIYSCAVEQTLNNLHEHEFLWSGKKCEPASVKLHDIANNFAVSCISHMEWIFGFIL